MKIVLRTAVFAFALMTMSCGKDTADAIADIFDEEAEQIEETVLDVEIVSDNVIIDGGTKMEGTPPTPNGAISLDVSNTSKTALLGEGFNISLNSDGNAIGAYLRFKSEDGTVADSYYDVNLSTNSDSSKSTKKAKSRRKGSNSLISKQDETLLDVDFNSTIAPGTFCYEICVYDTDGNISNPQEVCVTVESWGGSSKIEGTWNLFKEVGIFGGDSNTTLVGEKDCDNERVVECNNEDSFTSSYYCYVTNSSSLTFDANGTFEYTADYYREELEFNESRESCEAIFDKIETTELTKGNWAYVEESNELILIMYEDVYTDGGETETTTYESGEGGVFAEIGIFLVDDVIRIGPETESSENGYYRKEE